MFKMRKKLWLTSLLLMIGLGGYFIVQQRQSSVVARKPTKLYWFIPDGVRAEPDIFQIYKWAEEGRLPNIKQMMSRGTYGYSIPIFPGHTPANFATLFTGYLPRDHGVSDGPLRLWGQPMGTVANSGFSSSSKEKDPIWYTLERNGLVSSLLFVPGSTPPEMSTGQTVKGRWGGWGLEFPSVVFHSARDQNFREIYSQNDRIFNVGKNLTHLVEPRDAPDWNLQLLNVLPPQEIELSNWGLKLYGLLTAENQKKNNYTHFRVSRDKKEVLATLKEGEWSEWLSVELSYNSHSHPSEKHSQHRDKDAKIKFPTFLKIKAERISSPDSFRIRVLYSGINESLVFPPTLGRNLLEALGPMVDYPDDTPPQLIYFPEDRQTFLEEAWESFNWHNKAVEYFFKEQNQDVLIHNIYTPNQMLTSRWWMSLIDPSSDRHALASPEQMEEGWKDVFELYRRIDEVLGTALRNIDSNSYIVFSSDHGVAPLNTEVRLNNLFIKKGWLRFEEGDERGGGRVDWKNTKVVFLQSNHIYIHPLGFGSPYYPAKGEAYQKLLNEVRSEILNLREKKRVFSEVYTRVDATQKLGLPAEKIGDLVVVHHVGYSAVEEMSKDLRIFFKPLKSGYKQGLNPSETKSLWTPFMIMGPGIRPGYALQNPISHLDQYPLVMKILGVDSAVRLRNEELQSIFQ